MTVLGLCWHLLVWVAINCRVGCGAELVLQTYQLVILLPLGNLVVHPDNSSP